MHIIITAGEFEDLTADGREDNIKNYHEYNRMVLTGFVWRWMGTNVYTGMKFSIPELGRIY
jgi:hypothetical protein